MNTTRPTVKTVIFSAEDKYRKQKMINRLKSRKMLSSESEKYILRGRR